MAAVGFEVLFGSLTVTGSLIAMGKLQEWSRHADDVPRAEYFQCLPFHRAGVHDALPGFYPSQATVFYIMTGLGFLLGIMLVAPIGAADMPVVISLLNSYAGLAASAKRGFALGNNILIIGAPSMAPLGRFILSIIMCRAMNRSITNDFLAHLEGIQRRGRFGSERAGDVGGAGKKKRRFHVQ